MTQSETIYGRLAVWSVEDIITFTMEPLPVTYRLYMSQDMSSSASISKCTVHSCPSGDVDIPNDPLSFCGETCSGSGLCMHRRNSVKI